MIDPKQYIQEMADKSECTFNEMLEKIKMFAVFSAIIDAAITVGKKLGKKTSG